MHIPMSALAWGLPGGTEYIVILVVALLIFGRRLPSVMRSLGGSMREFKKGINEGVPEDEAEEAENKNSAPGSVSRDDASSETEGGMSGDDDKQRSL